MDRTVAARVGKLRRERKRQRLCRDCKSPLGSHDGIRCRSCQEWETLEQRFRRAARNEEKRIEVIAAVSQDIDYGMVFMLTNLALVDYTNRLENYFDELEKVVRRLALGLTSELPVKPQRIKHTQTWQEHFEKALDAGESIQGLDREGEIPEWPQKWAKGKDKDWKVPIIDTYLTAKPFYTDIVPQLADKGHRTRWKEEVLPLIPYYRYLMERHHIDLYDENMAMASAIEDLESRVEGKAIELTGCPPFPSLDNALLGLLSLQYSLLAGELEPLEAYSRSLKVGASLLEPRKFEAILYSLRK